MQRLGNVLCLCVLLWASAGQSAQAEEELPLSGEEWLTLRIAQDIRTWGTLREVTKGLLQQHHNADINDDGVSEADYGLRDQLDAASMRGAFIGGVFSKDVNGDGEVTRAEVETSITAATRNLTVKGAGDPAQLKEKAVREKIQEILAADLDGNGTVTFAEALAAAARRPNPFGPRLHANRPVSLDLDSDQDGRVTRAEFEAAISRVVSGIDTNGDGDLDGAEKAALSERAKALAPRAERERRNEQTAARCQFPPVPDGTKIVLVGTGQGTALSNLALGGDDAVVTVVEVDVEPGADQLYVVFVGLGATVWRVSGAVERLVRVVAASSKIDAQGATRAGVAGVAADKVHMSPRDDCLRPFVEPTWPGGVDTAKAVRVLVGRAPDHVAGAAGVGVVRIPSGQSHHVGPSGGAKSIPATGSGASKWRELLFSYPGGLVRMDAHSVVSGSSVRPYEVLPGNAGLAQLLDEGTLKILKETAMEFGGSEVLSPDGRKIYEFPSEIIQAPVRVAITKKMKFPAGLDVVRPMTFALLPGVPEPDGSPGASKIER